MVKNLVDPLKFSVRVQFASMFLNSSKMFSSRLFKFITIAKELRMMTLSEQNLFLEHDVEAINQFSGLPRFRSVAIS